MKTLYAALLAASLVLAPANASDHEETIERLLTAVGNSGCTFVRNGKEHSAEDAEDHLRMKYRRGKRYVSSVETFIKRIATKSSMSGKRYQIRCAGEDTMPTAEWLQAKLEELRGENQPQQ